MHFDHYFLMFAFSLSFHFSLGQYLSTPSGLLYAESVAQNISKTLLSFAKRTTNYHKITEHFEAIKADLEFKKIDGAKIVEDFTNHVEDLFSKKYKVLKKIKLKAENTKTSYKNDPNIGSFNYLNARSLKADNNSVKIVPEFSDTVAVNLTSSFVQVPTNIYSGSSDVLNTATWTAKLDETFLVNFDNHSDATMLYQYYGDSSGLFRVYPGNLFGNSPDNTNTKPDLFDCRRRVWYTQAAASAKDIVVIIDVSGSMIGNNIGIAKIIAAAIIDTLQEDDFFNVITNNNKAHFVEPCAKYLLQATKKNKEAMKLKIQQIALPSDVLDVDAGVKAAFDILEAGPLYNRTATADCNRAIMLITDGVEGSYAGKSVFEARNKDKSVRAFAFLVGRVKSPSKGALIDMACKNRGYFYPIETLGNVWDTVLEYIKVLSRPIAKDSKIQSPRYSPLYLDTSGLGMMMTVSLGVFVNEKLIGVAGTDVALASFKEQIPNHLMGVFSRVFVINNNGFVVMHPKFKEQSGYLPTPPNVYLGDLELSVDKNDTKYLKISMIDQEYGETSFSTFYTYDRSRKLVQGLTSYNFKPINGTDFSAASAIMEHNEEYLVVKDSVAAHFIQNGVAALYLPKVNLTENETISNWTYVQISEWNYCNILAGAQKAKPKSLKTYPTVVEIYDHLKLVKDSSTISSDCDSDLVKLLLTTAGIASTILNKTLASHDFSSNGGQIESWFVMTSGGYSKYFATKNTSLPYQRNVFKTSIYEVAAANPEASVVVEAPERAQNDNSNLRVFVTLAGASRITSTNKNNVLTAVSGVKITSDYFFEVLKIATKSKSSVIRCTEKSANISFLCAIIDQNGYIITSNQGNKYNGKFLGELNGPLIEHLANVSIFTKLVVNDTQVECPVPDEHNSASNILMTPVKLLFNAFRILITGTYWVLVHTFLMLISLLENNSYVHSQQVKTINVSCTQEVPIYLFNEATWKKNKGKQSVRFVQCDSTLQQEFSLSKIEGTNLLFVIADKMHGCRNRRVTLKPTRKKDTGICQAEEKYRRRPLNCFNETVQNEDKMCGAGAMEKPSLIILICMMLFSLIYIHTR